MMTSSATLTVIDMRLSSSFRYLQLLCGNG